MTPREAIIAAAEQQVHDFIKPWQLVMVNETATGWEVMYVPNCETEPPSTFSDPMVVEVERRDVARQILFSRKHI